MNIDLRNISSDFEAQVNKIKKEFDINTNSKAVEYSVINYLNKLEENKKLREELNKTKNEMIQYERRLDHLKELFTWILEK